MTDTFRNRQEDEIQVLKAIFMEDFNDIRDSDTWKVQRAPEFRLILKPQQSMGGVNEAYVHIYFYAKMTDRYPDELPAVILENPKGLSVENQKKLQKEIDSLSKTLRGQEMMLELCQHIQRFLHAFNKPPTSFYEQMLSNQQKQKDEIEREQQKQHEIRRRKVEKERQYLEEELQRRQEVLKMEIKKRKDNQNDSSLSSSLESVSPNFSSFGQSPVDLESHNLMYKHDSTNRQSNERKRVSLERRKSCRDHAHLPTTIHFTTKGQRTIHRGHCLGHSDNGSTVYAGMDAKSGELVAIREWTYTFDRGRRKSETTTIRMTSDDCRKQVVSIEQEMNALIKLRHPNLLLYLAMKHTAASNGNVQVMILSEYCGGTSLHSYITQSLPLPIDMVHCYTRQILDALQFLHKRDVVHKHLTASSIFVDNTGQTRLADYSINKRLSDLHREVASQQTHVHFHDNESKVGSTSKKADIYELGFLLLTLIEGKNVAELYADLRNHLPSEFRDFISKCVESEECERWTADQLNEHSFIKQPVTRPIHVHLPPAAHNHALGEKICDEEDDMVDELAFVTSVDVNGQSRLTNEFTVLKLLGKGGFGDVIKVRNKLDAQFYAIKRIPLNPKSKHFNRKITREAKLLSRMNHENVVRYYNSWIETSTESTHEDSSSCSESIKCNSSRKPTDPSLDSLGLNDDMDKAISHRAPEAGDWSESHDSTAYQSDDSDSDDGVGVFCASFMPDSDSDSDGIMFLQDIGSSEKSTDNITCREVVVEENIPAPKIHYLYIQMEYCERSTLRDSIQAGLHADVDRVWRLFREIIEGLHHIHEKGMIHRDLKPVNIFLDSNDHIKIGDFGLATTSAINRGHLKDTSGLNASTDMNVSSRSESVGDGVLTGKVGTALYVSPEMMSTETKASYSQKVDIYSLGVILFEMCYPPLGTGMERIKVLTNIRQPSIQLPEDFDCQKLLNQSNVIRWLLDHDPHARPSSTELLQSDYLPPPQRQEGELHEMLRSTVSNPQSKPYRHLVKLMFSQLTTPLNDLTYDMDLGKGPKELLIAQQYVQECLVQIFRCHGAMCLTTPLLMPYGSMYDHTDQYVSLMDHSGRIVALPYDLRVPFARYIARSGVASLKRFCIARVYREKKLFSLHPKEILECAYDVITPTTAGLFPDAEILQIIQEIINRFPPLQTKNYYICMNHMSLLRAVLLHCGIGEEKHQATLEKLAATQQKKAKKADVYKMLCEVTSERQAALLLSIKDTEGDISKVSSFLRCITKTRGQAASLAKQGLHDIEEVIKQAQNMAVKMPMTVSLGLIYAVKQYSGTIFHVMYRKKHGGADVLVAGGRYDKLISEYSSPLLQSRGVTSANQHGAGFSLAFDKICTAMLECDELAQHTQVDVLVCNVSHSTLSKETLAVAADLWGAGIRAEVKCDIHNTLPDIEEYCSNSNIPFIVVVKDAESVYVRSVEKDKISERRVKSSELYDFLSNKLATKLETGEGTQPSQKKQNSNATSSDVPFINASPSNVALNITFVSENDNSKLPANTKRKVEAQMYAKLSCLHWVSNKVVVEAIAAELPPNVVKSVASLLDLSGSVNAFTSSIASVVETHPPYRKYLSRIFDVIDDLKFKNKCPVLVLYGFNIKQDTFKLLL